MLLHCYAKVADSQNLAHHLLNQRTVEQEFRPTSTTFICFVYNNTSVLANRPLLLPISIPISILTFNTHRANLSSILSNNHERTKFHPVYSVPFWGIMVHSITTAHLQNQTLLARKKLGDNCSITIWFCPSQSSNDWTYQCKSFKKSLLCVSGHMYR